MLLSVAGFSWAEDAAPTAAERGFTHEQVLEKADGFFGGLTEGIAKAIGKVFEERGRPSAIIQGEEVSAAIGIGVRYGRGDIVTVRTEEHVSVFWQGPSVGFDWGGNASKVFTLVYNLDDVEHIYQRFPGVEGSFYFVAGVGVNYQQSGEVILAPIRTGVGLRAGASVGYLHYTKEKSWLPF